MKWDSAINLAFAAESLFAAAQLLTSDLLPWDRALRLAYEKHLVPLVENDDFLPEDIRERLLEARRSYLRASSNGLSPTFARQRIDPAEHGSRVIKAACEFGILCSSGG